MIMLVVPLRSPAKVWRDHYSMLFSASRPRHDARQKLNTNRIAMIRLQRTPRPPLDTAPWQLYSPGPVWLSDVWPVFSPLTNVICSNQPIKLGRAGRPGQTKTSSLQPGDSNSFVFSTVLPLAPQPWILAPHWPLTGRTRSFVSVLTRQTCPDPAWVIGWKLVHWHYWYNIITSQPTPNTGSLSPQISVNNNKNV